MKQKSIYSKEQEKLVSKLKKAREEAGFTQAQAAKKMQRTQSYISKVESGQLKIDIVEIKRFSNLYKKDISYFIN